MTLIELDCDHKMMLRNDVRPLRRHTVAFSVLQNFFLSVSLFLYIKKYTINGTLLWYSYS
ncbi:hypothetical protein ACHAXS_000492, partial [Conticribra weissflogii]